MPSYTRPLVPLRVIQSPSLRVLPATFMYLPATLISRVEHPTMQHLPQPLATSAAWEVIPPLP